MKPTLMGLTEEFTALIGPEAFAKAEAAIATAKAAAKAAAEKAAATAAAAAAAAPKSAVPPAAGAATGARLPAAAASAVAPTANAAASVRPPSVPPAAAAPLPALPLQATPHAAKGYDLDATVAPQQVVQAAELVDRAGLALDTITGVDWIAQSEMEVVYDFFHPTESLRVVVRTRVPRATPELPSITAVFPGANWHERETHDFFGIRFVGHPNLKPFLLPEDANFHPLRKDYQP